MQDTDSASLLNQTGHGTGSPSDADCPLPVDRVWCLKTRGRILFYLIVTTIATLGLATALVLVFELKKPNSPADLCPVAEAPASFLEVKNYTMFATIREKFVRELAAEGYSFPEGFAYLKGGVQEYLPYSDTEILFRQESNFFYLTGYDYPDGTALVNLNTGELYLFVELWDESLQLWNGPRPTLDQLVSVYGAVYANTSDHLADFVNNTLRPSTLLLLPDAEPIPDTSGIDYNNTVLRDVLFAARDIKTDDELDLMRVASKISKAAHTKLQSKVEPGWNEMQATGEFRGSCQGCMLRFQSYVPIVAAGTHAATLHYTANDAEILKGQTMLVDAAASFFNYCSDITTSWSVGASMSDDQKAIYRAVQKTQADAIPLYRPGAHWGEISSNASMFLLRGLLAAGVVAGGTPEEMYQAGIHGVFQPHGLGHMIGLTVHDTTSYPRGPLAAGMVFTCEPGIYFEPSLLADALASNITGQYIVKEVAERMVTSVGGIRIEDVLIVTQDAPEIISVPWDGDSV